MKRKYSLAHLTVLSCPPPEMIYIAKMAGYDYVGIRPIFCNFPGEPNYELAKKKDLLIKTKQALDDTGIEIFDIELARVAQGIDVKQYEPAVEVSAELGAKHIISSIWTPDKDFYLEQFAKLCDIAVQYGMSVDLEFVTWAEVRDLNEAMEVLNTVKRKNVGIMLDTFHAHNSRVASSELDNVPEEWFHFAHICDGPVNIPDEKEALINIGRSAREYVGHGVIDIASYINKMPESTVLSIELPHAANTADFGCAEHARRCLATAKEYFGD